MTPRGGAHQPPHLEQEVLGPSNRSFGLLFGVVFAIAGLAPLARGGSIRPWALALSIACGVIAVAIPRALTPFNRAWVSIALAMHHVVSPLVMAVLFYLAVTPFGLIVRLLRTGLARRLRPDPAAPSYWTTRESYSRMDQQF